MIKHYNYYSRVRIENILEEFSKIIYLELKLEVATTKYSRIQTSATIDSSNYFLEEYKIINDIPNSLCIDIYRARDKDWKKIENVIFFDDIIGTGKTVSDFFKENLEKLKKVNCYIFCIEIMYDAKIFLEHFFDEYEINCTLYSHNVQKKAFNIDILGYDYIMKEKIFNEHEQEIWGRKNRYIMGFENSQAIVSFFRNTPNNTLSSFWYNKSNWKGLFPRTDPNNWIEEKNIENRKNIKYNLAKMERIVDD